MIKNLRYHIKFDPNSCTKIGFNLRQAINYMSLIFLKSLTSKEKAYFPHFCKKETLGSVLK